MKPVYLDYNATTPIDPRVAEAMLPYLRERFGNPSSVHCYGVEARSAVDTARRQVAELLGCDPAAVIFTSGGSEANNLALKGVALAQPRRGDHLITTAIEHPAVLEVFHYLEQQGFRASYLEVDRFGRLDPQTLRSAIEPTTALVSVMHANNEIGTIQPIAELAAITHEHGALFHVDAAQSVGKIPVNVEDLGVDLLSLAAHKLYGPAGVGALYVRPGTVLAQQVHGAGHEHGMRAGTESVMLLVGLGRACEIVATELERDGQHFATMRDRLRQGLEREVGALQVNGHPDLVLPNTLSVSFSGVRADRLIAELTEVAASAGSACHADSPKPSAVLTAIGLPAELSLGTLRLSTGRATSEADIDRAVSAIAAALRR